MVKMCSRFPGCVMVRITNPFDKVFLVVVSSAMVEDLVDFEFFSILDGDWVRRRCRNGAMIDGVRRSVWSENGYVKDWMYLEGVGEVKFVCDRRDFLNHSVWANEPVL